MAEHGGRRQTVRLVVPRSIACEGCGQGLLFRLAESMAYCPVCETMHEMRWYYTDGDPGPVGPFVVRAYRPIADLLFQSK